MKKKRTKSRAPLKAVSTDFSSPVIRKEFNLPKRGIEEVSTNDESDTITRITMTHKNVTKEMLP